MKATSRRFTATLGFWSLIALAVGLVLGIYGFETGSPWISGLARALQPLGVLWLNALRMVVLPLVVLQLLTAITGNGNGASLAAVGKRTVSLIVIMLISFTSLGVPNGGASFRALPAYLAAGIPVKGLVLLQAVKDISDYGYTLANTTGQSSRATILSRGDRS